MRHVQQRARGVPLHPHIFGLCQPRKRDESTRLCDLGLVLICPRGYPCGLMRCVQTVGSMVLGHTMCSEIGHTSDGIALHLDVRTEHLADQRLQSA
jgi:hypothetical protein